MNIYSAYNVINLITKVDIEKHQLILWTILCTHWPELSNWLVAAPDRLTYLQSGQADQIPEALQEVLQLPTLQRLLQGGPDEHNPLSRTTLLKCKEMLA